MSESAVINEDRSGELLYDLLADGLMVTIWHSAGGTVNVSCVDDDTRQSATCYGESLEIALARVTRWWEKLQRECQATTDTKGRNE